MSQSARKIILRIGIFGLAANVVSLIPFSSLLLPVIAISVGYLATKGVFEQTKLSENPPTFWGGAKIGLISGSIVTVPILLLGAVGLSVFYIANGASAIDGDAEELLLVMALAGFAVLLLSGFSIVLSTIAGGVTAAKLLRGPNNPI